jgi:rod shape-determining protein MreD
VSIYLAIPLLVAIAIVQGTVLPHLAIRGVFPELPVLAVASWSLLRGSRQGLVWGFIAGLAVDLLSGAPFGAATLAMLAAGGLAGLARDRSLQLRMFLPVVTAFLATAVYALVFLTVIRLSGQAVPWLDTLYRIVLPAAGLNAVLMPVVYGLLYLLHRWIQRREEVQVE